MTRDSDFKKLVRQRMAKTGESYTTARRHLEENPAPEASLEGWFITGPGDGSPDWKLTDFEGGIDPKVTRAGKPCAYLRSTVEEPELHGVIMQSIDSAAYHGQRIRFSAWVKQDSPETCGELWVRVVPIHRDRTFARGIWKANEEWRQGSVVVDVDPRSTSIMFGVSLEGDGTVWMSGADLEVVDESVPLTQEGSLTREPRQPINLDFQSG